MESLDLHIALDNPIILSSHDTKSLRLNKTLSVTITKKEVRTSHLKIIGKYLSLNSNDLAPGDCFLVLIATDSNKDRALSFVHKNSVTSPTSSFFQRKG